MLAVAAGELEDLVQRVFVAAGSPAETARTVARSLVLANLKGVDSHGVVRVAEYVAADRPRPNRPGRGSALRTGRSHGACGRPLVLRAGRRPPSF